MTQSEFTELFCRVMSECSMPGMATDENARRFFALTEQLLAYNAHTNLTAITEPEDIIVKHYADSLAAAAALGDARSLCDVGCGAGFPSLPLAMTLPALSVTSMDSTAKKLRFIDEAAAALGLNNIRTLCARAEDAAAFVPQKPERRRAKSAGKTSASDAKSDKSLRESFDAVCARAVAPLRVLCEYCLPLCAVGGKFIALKGADAARAIDESRAAIETLGGKIADKREIPLVLRGERLEHNVIIIQKVAATPKIYPRSNALISKNPL